MNLPFFKKTENTSPREYLFALEIDHHLVKSSVWSVVNAKPSVLSVGLPASWDDKSEESLIQACDHSLTDSTNRLDQSGKIQPEKVILGLPLDWIVQEKIQPEKLRVLKSLAQQLSLTIVGFVVTTEAIIDHLHHLDGVPPTAILVGLHPHQLDVTLVRLGKVEGTQTVVRSSKITQDLIEGLSRFSHVDMLPSRILLYDSNSDLEDIRQKLLAHPWQSPQTKLPFLHFPKIETLPADFSVQAISLSGGQEVAQATGMVLPDLPDPTTTSKEQVKSDLTPQDLGFSRDLDVSTSPLSQVPVITEPELFATEETSTTTQTSAHSRASSKPKFHFSFPKVKLPSLKLPHFFYPRFSSSSGAVFIVLIIASLTALLVAYWYLPTATVTLTVRPETITHQFTLGVGSDGVPSHTIEVSTSEDKSIPTTGSKLIGDKATGEVTIINGTSQPKSFTAGTILTSPSGLKFQVTTDALVASASGSADPNSYQPGKANVKVTAEQIGNDSNITAGTQFKVGSFSSLDFIAKNDSAFSGGSSRQVKAVSKEDMSSLKSSLESSAKSKADEQFAKKIQSHESVVSESIQTRIDTEDYNHKLDEVTDELKLTLATKSSALVVSKEDLAGLVSSEIESQIPTNYTLTDQIDYKFAVQSKDAGKLNLTVDATATLLPVLNQEQIKDNLKGKFPSPAVEYLKTLPGVSRVDIAFPFPLPKPILTLPHLPQKITIVVSSQN